MTWIHIVSLLLVPIVAFTFAQDNPGNPNFNPGLNNQNTENNDYDDPEDTIERLHVVNDCDVNNDCQPLFILYFLDGYCDIIRNSDGVIVKHGCRYELNLLIFLLLFLLPLLLLTIVLLITVALRLRKERFIREERRDERRPQFITAINPNFKN